MNKNSLMTFVVLLCGAQLQVHAAERRQSLHDQLTGQGYGLAGCGLGSVIFGPKKGLVQVFAASSNQIQSNQSFGITSGTSNCDIPEMGLVAASYIEINKEVLKKEAARGQGETLKNLATIFDCANQTEFDQAIRDNYSEIFIQTDDSFQSTREIMKLIDSQKKLNCKKS